MPLTLTETSTPVEFAVEEMRRGQRKAKTLHRCRLEDTFTCADSSVHAVVAMSDMHGACPNVVTKLIKRGLSDTVVICTGDMAGNGSKGGNSDPYPQYVRLRDAARALYLVQGNHDAYSKETLALRNDDGTPCCVDGRVVATPIGLVGGVSGIVSDHPNPALHKLPANEFDVRLAAVVAKCPDVLLTHTPLEEYYAVPIHLYGHAPVTPYAQFPAPDRVTLCMDNRIFWFARSR